MSLLIKAKLEDSEADDLEEAKERFVEVITQTDIRKPIWNYVEIVEDGELF